MTKSAFRLFAVLACAIASASAQSLLELNAGIHRIEAEVANTQEARMRGLMHRKSMTAQRGMLFVYDAPSPQCMWMRNTLISLSVAFLDEQGRIINVEEMQPRTEINHCAARPAKYALEMNVGWFRQRGLGVGAPIGGIDRAPPAR
ncbi:MAG: DUF192 domain-containing protein [Rhodocyclaceae bacterium]|nr:DUF192 domain-containing protein [Rhodocyclaceae bacterium]